MKLHFAIAAVLLLQFLGTSHASYCKAEREVNVENNYDWFKVASKEVDKCHRMDAFDVNFHQYNEDNGLFEIFLSYITEEHHNMTKIEYKVRFYSILEYAEKNGVKGYQEDEDELVQRYKLGHDDYWLQFTGPQKLWDYNYFGASTADGTLAIGGYVSEKATRIPRSNYELDPYEVKFDIWLNFSKRAKRHDTYIALEARIKTWAKVQDDTQYDKFVTFYGNKEAHASLAWVDYAETSVGTVPIYYSHLKKLHGQDEPEYQVYYTFGTTSKYGTFYWDPSIKVSPASVSEEANNNTQPDDVSAATLIGKSFFLMISIWALVTFIYRFF